MSTWKPKDLAAKKFDKILVLGLMQEKGGDLREKMEQHLLTSLQFYGYNVICACEEYGPKSFENMTEKQAIDGLTNKGIDAVLTVVLLNKTKERYYVPGRSSYSPYTMYNGQFWNYYTTMHDRIYSTGYYREDTKYFWETNLYDLSTKELLYSIQTGSFNPESTESLSLEYGQLIAKNVVKNKILLVPEKSQKAF
jgi:hypothetical protein